MPLGAGRIAFLAKTSVAAAAEVIRKKIGVAANGNAQIDTAQSQFGGTSALFDGTDDYLLASSLTPGLTNVGTGDWTYECWFRTSDGTFALFDTRESGSTGGAVALLAGANASGKIDLYYDDGFRILGPTTVNDSSWHHIAVVKNSGSIQMYLDGSTYGSSYSDSASLSTNDTMKIGVNFVDGYDYNGYIDEFRISNTARYTTGFTVDTAPFVNDDNTLLLLHMNGTDGSTFFEDDNGTGRSQVGVRARLNAQIDTAQSYFGGTSAVFDGTGDALVVDQTITDFGGDDFTIECWFRRTGTSGDYENIIGTWSASSSERQFFLGIDNNTGSLTFFYVNSSGTINTSDFNEIGSISNDTWYHLAIVGDSTNFTLYLDGTSQQQASRQTLRTPIDEFSIGAANGTNYLEFNGYVDEVRVSDSARYTGNFTPSTTPFVNDANTVLLLHMDGTDGGTDFSDDNGKGRSAVGVRAEGTGQVDTAQYKYGGSSFVANGSGDDNLAIDQDAYDWTVFNDHTNTNNYTIECWIRSTNVATTNAIFGTRTSTASHNWDLEIRTDNGNGTLRWFNGNSELYYSAGGAVSADTWHHIAAVIEGADLTVYVDGTAAITQTRTDSNTTGGSDFFIGKGGFPTLNKFYGNIDEFRISDIARYTSGFTAPTEPFENDANTLLLLHMNGTDGSTTFIDDNGTYAD